MARTLDRLPPEILGRIVQHVAGSIVRYHHVTSYISRSRQLKLQSHGLCGTLDARPVQQTRKRLSLVSKMLRSAALPHLFRTISLNLDDLGRMLSLLDDLRPDTWQIVNTLRLAARFDFDDPPPTRSTAASLQGCLVHFFRYAANLRQLEWRPQLRMWGISEDHMLAMVETWPTYEVIRASLEEFVKMRPSVLLSVLPNYICEEAIPQTGNSLWHSLMLLSCRSLDSREVGMHITSENIRIGVNEDGGDGDVPSDDSDYRPRDCRHYSRQCCDITMLSQTSTLLPFATICKMSLSTREFLGYGTKCLAGAAKTLEVLHFRWDLVLPEGPSKRSMQTIHLPMLSELDIAHASTTFCHTVLDHLRCPALRKLTLTAPNVPNSEAMNDLIAKIAHLCGESKKLRTLDFGINIERSMLEASMSALDTLVGFVQSAGFGIGLHILRLCRIRNRSGRITQFNAIISDAVRCNLVSATFRSPHFWGLPIGGPERKTFSRMKKLVLSAKPLPSDDNDNNEEDNPNDLAGSKPEGPEFLLRIFLAHDMPLLETLRVEIDGYYIGDPQLLEMCYLLASLIKALPSLIELQVYVYPYEGERMPFPPVLTEYCDQQGISLSAY